MINLAKYKIDNIRNNNKKNSKQSSFNKSFKKGLTLIELIFIMLLLGIIIYTIWRVFITGTRTSTRLSQSVELAATARIADTKMLRELRMGVELISPTTEAGTPETSSVIIFLNKVNQMIVFYVNKNNQLMRQNRNWDSDTLFYPDNSSGAETVLAENVSAFRAYRKGRRLLNYHLEIAVDDPKLPDGKRRFSLISSITFRNNFN